MKLLYKLSVMLMAVSGIAQEQKATDSAVQKLVELNEVLVSAIRAKATLPISFSNVNKQQIAPRNLGQDIPVLLQYLPAVVTTSDAGAGVGYTSIRVRGSDATRVNITINGIPYNDAESQGTFWVNLPDFASSVESFQLQRGVGTSTNGAGAFGASLNLLTDTGSETANGEISNTFGSFNTRKHTVKFSTGKIDDRLELAGRVSVIRSDGYIDRASADLKSYFFQTSYSGKRSTIKALLFGGHEITYQAWNGIDAETLRNNRTFNISGMYTDMQGNTQFYDNEIDHYKQDHLQLHWSTIINNYWYTTLAFHYTYGRGFFEQYKEDEDFTTYGLKPITIGEEVINTTDLIRRRWLDNDFYGTTFSATYNNKPLELIIGGAWNTYKGDHFGEIIWARYAANSDIRDRYYDNRSHKTDFNFFAKATYALNKQWNIFGDLQYRRVGYETRGPNSDLIPLDIEERYNFFNPKAGIVYTINQKNSVYLSYAVAHREPNRTDLENGNPSPEKLQDIEMGWRYTTTKARIHANIYYMKYTNQLVLTGQLDDVGAAIRTNSGDSYRLGIELDAVWSLSKQWMLRPNIAWSTNKNINFIAQRNGNLERLGTTHISFSPEIIAANTVTFKPKDNIQFSLLSKYVGVQYMSNTDAEKSKLGAYFTTDFNIQYDIKPRSVFHSILFQGLINNILDKKYVSNGYYYTFNVDNGDNTITTQEGVGYYPQAGIHFLLGVTLRL